MRERDCGNPGRQAVPAPGGSPVDAGVERLAMLDGEECARTLEQVQALREHWVRRFRSVPVYTLGAASYLDSGPGARDAYYGKAAALNPLLERTFGWLYDRLLRTLGKALGAPVAFEPRAARPGFHIFLAPEDSRRPFSAIHFDLQYLDIDWSGHDTIDFSRPLSYTLAVRLPRSGAGLWTWNVEKPEYDAMEAAARERLDEERTPRYVAYREGEMIHHSGLLLHRLAPTRPGTGTGMRPDDVRLTLQGHALPDREGYWLYW